MKRGYKVLFWMSSAAGLWGCFFALIGGGWFPLTLGIAGGTLAVVIEALEPADD